MIFKSADQKRERRDRFQAGNGGGYCTHALEPSGQIRGSRFHQASRVELDPGAVIGEHLHAGNEEIYWILSGSGLFIDDGIETAATPGGPAADPSRGIDMACGTPAANRSSSWRSWPATPHMPPEP